MTKQEFDLKYRVNKAIHCDTEEKANKFLELAHSVGYRWANHKSLLDLNYYHNHRKNTCYTLDDTKGVMMYSGKDFYEVSGYNVDEFGLETFNVGDVVYYKGSTRPLTILRKAWVVCYPDKTTYEHFVEERSLSKPKPLQKITREELAEKGYELVD